MDKAGSEYLDMSPYQAIKDLKPFWRQIGTIEEMIGDEVRVRFGETLVLVPVDMLAIVPD